MSKFGPRAKRIRVPRMRSLKSQPSRSKQARQAAKDRRQQGNLYWDSLGYNLDCF